MPEARKPSKQMIAAVVLELILGVGGIIALAVTGLLLSFWLIFPIVFVVFALATTGKILYDYYQEEKTTSGQKPKISLEAANRNANENAGKAKSKLTEILKQNGLDFDKAGAGIRIKSANKIAGVAVFYLTYELIDDIFGNFQATEDQKNEFVKGKEMILELLPRTKENSAIQINDVMELDENIRLTAESSIKSDPVLTQPTPSTDSKPRFPSNDLYVQDIQNVTKNSEPITNEQKVEFKKRISDVFENNQLSDKELDVLRYSSINLCEDLPVGLRMQGGTYYEFCGFLVSRTYAHEWSTWLAWVKEQIDKSFSWPRSGPNEPLHVNESEVTGFQTSRRIKLVVRADAIQQLLEAKKEVSSLGLSNSSSDT